MDGTELAGTVSPAGMEPGMVGTTSMDGLPLPEQLLSPPTGGTIHGEHGITNGTAGTHNGDGTHNGEQDPHHGTGENGQETTMDGTEVELSLLPEQELSILKPHK